MKCLICHKRFKSCYVITIQNPKTGKDISVHEECFRKMMSGDLNDDKAPNRCLNELDTPKKIGPLTFSEFLQKAIIENVSASEFRRQVIANGMGPLIVEASTQAYMLIQEAIKSGHVSTKKDKHGKIWMNKDECMRFAAMIQPTDKATQ